VNSKELIYTLNLQDYPNTYIQKVVSGAIPTFVVTYNSRYPYKLISAKKLKNTPVSTIYRSSEKIASRLKLTPPVLLYNFSSTIPLNSIVFVRDIGGEGLLTPRNLDPSMPEDDPTLLGMAIDYVKTIL
jgi:hypothetical protein